MVESRAENLDGGAFDPGIYWDILEQNGDLIQEERIDEDNFHAPNSPEGEVQLY